VGSPRYGTERNIADQLRGCHQPGHQPSHLHPPRCRGRLDKG
ncbi:MAG: hypothetical protein AVDCRST_MAG22-3530, partial [uncultured Rubrobacteraceae bacterium]